MTRSYTRIPILLAFAVTAGFYIYSRSMISSPTSPAPGEVPLQLTGPNNENWYGPIDPATISFVDSAETNSDQTIPISELTLLNEEMENVVLSDLQDGHNLMLVILRGAPLCPFCTAQTSRLVSHYQKFTELGSRVAVVFPGTKDDLNQLLTKAKLDGQELPFPILVDTDLSTIKRLDIEGNNALPATFIIDRDGRTQFAYVGASDGDRPSIKALLTALERIKPTPSVNDTPANDAPQDS